MGYYPEPNTRIKSKKAVYGNFSNYATKSDFAKKADLCGWKSDVKKFGIEKPVKVSRGLKGLKSRVHNLDVSKWKNFRDDLRKLCDVINKDVLKKLKYNVDKQGLRYRKYW